MISLSKHNLKIVIKDLKMSKIDLDGLQCRQVEHARLVGNVNEGGKEKVLEGNTRAWMRIRYMIKFIQQRSLLRLSESLESSILLAFRPQKY